MRWGLGSYSPPPYDCSGSPLYYRFLKKKLLHVWKILLGISLSLDLFTNSYALLNYVCTLLSILTNILNPQGVLLVIMDSTPPLQTSYSIASKSVKFTCKFFFANIFRKCKKDWFFATWWEFGIIFWSEFYLEKASYPLKTVSGAISSIYLLFIHLYSAQDKIY